MDHPILIRHNGRIRLSISTINCTYELSEITHVTPGSLSMENIWLGQVLTDRESVPAASFSAVSLFLRFVVTKLSNEIVNTEGCHVGLFVVHRYGLLYIRKVEYNQCIAMGGLLGYARFLPILHTELEHHLNGQLQNFSISSVLATESCTKPYLTVSYLIHIFPSLTLFFMKIFHLLKW